MTQADLFAAFDAAAPNPHRLLLASAGTGKTYQLSGHFAALLVLGVEPERVLATTFTRKAAGEILDRVLGRVREAASGGERGEEARAALDETVRRIAPHAARLDREHCEAVLARLVRRIDRFQIRTLDAFFVRLARLFAPELEIAPEWRIIDDVEQRAIVSEAVARVLDGLEFDERLELLRGMTRGTAKRGAESALVETVEKAERIGRDALPGAWARVEPLDGPDAGAIAAALGVVAAAEAPNTKAGKPNVRWAKALDALREELGGAQGPSSSLPASLLGHTLVTKALAGESSYYSADIPDALADGLRVLGRGALAGMTAELIARNAATASFLEHHERADRALRAELGAYRFEDFSRALLDGPLRQSTSEWMTELGYRLDGRLDHLLLDEFQDTAPAQWRLLAPLAEEVLAAGADRSFFCVGDVKQSIYGWRGGEPRLLANMARRFPVLEPEALVRSFRSSGIVLDAVNLVFEGIDARPCLADPKHAAALSATASWAQGFERHTSARPELRGEARLWRARPRQKPDEGTLEPCLRLAVERVEALFRAHPGASIAILVRARAQIARLRYLLAERGIEASDEGGNPLTDSLGVTWILGLLHLADHPGDRVAALQVARSPFGGRFGLHRAEVGSAAGDGAAEVAAAGVRASLLRRGYGEFVGELVRELLPSASAWDARRLEQLVELALAFDPRATLRPIDFVELIREQRVPDPTASRVKVMTIHASKGLEFDAVVLPELGKGIRLSPDGYMAGADSEVDPPSIATAVPKKELAAEHPQLGELYRREQERAMVDALSGLYVAMTRAVHCLELIVPTPSESSRSAPLQHATLAAPPLEAQACGARAADPAAESETERAELVWQHPESVAGWTPGDGRGHRPAYLDEPALRLRPEDERQVADSPGHDVRRPSGSQERRPASAAGLLGAAEPDAFTLGTLVHALFEDFRWLDDETRTDDELRSVCSRALLAPERADLAIAIFRRALASEELAGAFTRPQGDVTLMTERSFDVEVTDVDPDPYRVRGTIDRLVLRTEGERVTEAHVMDFKTDASGDPDQLLSAHGAQLAAYRDAVAALFGLEVSAVRASILWVSADGARLVDATSLAT